ncbi:uncharacterized protein BDW47DRAFT_113176 [Aspergillus candidus]|uniref:Alcohol dehydrogenase n=1 Tax=Aspergillus candidus TaxID=41067 RepID=A0A2I2EZX9_ASPCN|nr:alcohol dehydrogenase [Aspergillus candidus]PLB33908.1 alcohol dehydrogenase [Aspergillus candidus]
MSSTATNSDTLYTTLKTDRSMKTADSMKSVRFHGPGDIRVDVVDEPVCGKGQVKMRPAYVGICGSDLHEYNAGPVLIPKKPHPLTGTSYPVTLGHEFGGIVEEIGEGVTHVSPGQRVVVRPTIYDGTCRACQMGYNYCCENIGFIGLSGYGGGLSKFIVAPGDHFNPIPDSISLKSAALIEPLAVAWHAVNVSPLKPNDRVFMIGSGPIGIGVIQVLKLRGAGQIIVSEMMGSRKRQAVEFGATDVLDPREVDVTQRVRELTDGMGADIIFDTAGVEVALNGAIGACRSHGTIVNIAVWENRPAIRVNDLMYNEVKYTGSALYDEASFQDVIRALDQKQLQPESMITTTVKMDDVVEKGFKALLEDRENYCKILVDAQGCQ